MQSLTGSPREHLTEAQVYSLITGDQVTVTAGLELLDTANQFVEDISADLVAGTISWDNRSVVRGSCRLTMQRELAWGRDRVRPYMVLSHNGVSARFDFPPFVLSTPDTNRAESPVTFEVTGYDLISLMQSGPANTYVIGAGAGYLSAAQAVVTASGVGSTLFLDGDAQSMVLPATRVWALTEQQPTYIRILTDLLAEVGYVAPWVDSDGNLRSRPFQPVEQRAVEWVIDTGTADNIIAEDRTVSIETGDVANAWKFGMANAQTAPTEGNGLYTPPPNLTDGPNSIEALGRTVWKFRYLQAADHAALVAQGDKIVATDKASVRTISIPINPLPLMGADDVFEYIDLGVKEKVAAASWTLDLLGGNGLLQLGGAPPTPMDPVETSAKATVTDDAPLSVRVDGATTSSFANALDAAVYSPDDRVNILIRNPIPPLVQGVETVEE